MLRDLRNVLSDSLSAGRGGEGSMPAYLVALQLERVCQRGGGRARGGGGGLGRAGGGGGGGPSLGPAAALAPMPQAAQARALDAGQQVRAHGVRGRACARARCRGVGCLRWRGQRGGGRGMDRDRGRGLWRGAGRAPSRCHRRGGGAGGGSCGALHTGQCSAMQCNQVISVNSFKHSIAQHSIA
jgi:hypothetical protein